MTDVLAGRSQEETNAVVVCLSQTQSAVLNAYNDLRSWRELGAKLSLPHIALYSIGRAYWSHVSWDTVRLVRQRLGLSDPGPVIYTLAPGDVVRRPGKPRQRKRYHRPCMDDDTYAEWLVWRATREETT